MRTAAIALAASGALAPVASTAADLDLLQALSQSEFRLLSEDLGAALSFKPLIPTAPLGIVGFDVGLAVTGTSLKSASVLEKATSGDAVSTLPVPTLRAHKGLPLGIDVGLSYGTVPDSNIRFWGAELRYALLSGNLALPAIGLRASHTQLQGVDQLGLRTTGLDVSISKGFAFVTPYAGLGQVWVRSSPKGVPTLAGESFRQDKVFGGVNVNLGLGNLAVEVDSTGGITSYGAKVGLRF